MPGGVAWFTGHQPVTPVIQTLRGLLTGTPSGHRAVLAVAWCLAIAATGYLIARTRYDRTRPVA